MTEKLLERPIENVTTEFVIRDVNRLLSFERGMDDNSLTMLSITTPGWKLNDERASFSVNRLRNERLKEFLLDNKRSPDAASIKVWTQIDEDIKQYRFKLE